MSRRGKIVTLMLLGGAIGMALVLYVVTPSREDKASAIDQVMATTSQANTPISSKHEPTGRETHSAESGTAHTIPPHQSEIRDPLSTKPQVNIPLAKKIRDGVALDQVKEDLNAVASHESSFVYSATAAANGRTEILRHILQRSDGNFTQSDIDMLLPGAVNSGNWETVDLLLQLGADPHAVVADGSGLIEIALSSDSSYELVPKLLAMGIPPQPDVLNERIRNDPETAARVREIENAGYPLR
ncbi:hypothetical protein [Salinisphaera sp. PC39]|uniref:hypothetical protein n=1 Tax=Salinisphaera sp. PC39 TaxID=1304156 RepID=UPI00333EFC0F